MVEGKNFSEAKRLVYDTTLRPSVYDRAHLRMISLMHDTFYSLFVDPKKLLRAAGLARGQRVLEVGCGPGFFTTEASRILGNEGRLYSIDINPAAVVKVGRKVAKAGLENTEVKLANVTNTGIPDNSLDIAFFFGIAHSLGDLDPILKEMHLVLKENGIISVQRSSASEEKLIDNFTRLGLFCCVGNERRIYRFGKASC